MSTMLAPKVLAIIPAKETSRRIPGKNIKIMVGKPMLAYIIEAVKGARGVDRVIVSTESENIKRVAEQYGAEVPFMRPMELTRDDVPTYPVITHALEALKQREGYEPDYVLLIYPTSPLLQREHIQKAIQVAVDKNSDSVISGTYDKGHYWTQEDSGRYTRFFPKTLVNSQQQTPLFKENGGIYLTKTSVIAKQLIADSVDILLMEKEDLVDVDEPSDFALAEQLLKKQSGIGI